MSCAELDLALDKIRVHKHSKLSHQKTPAVLLIALEQTFAEQVPPTTRSPVAYCAALCTTLEQSVKAQAEAGRKIGMGEGDLIPGALYILAAVLPYVPTAVMRAQLPTFLPLLAPLLPVSLDHAPALRSLLSVLSALWNPLDAPTLTGTPLLRNAWANVLQLCVDSRPKIRKKAQEVVRDVLSAPPPPMSRHPYADQTAQMLLGLITDVSPDQAEHAIWACAWAKAIAPFCPPAKLLDLLQALLTLPSLNVPFLTAAAYTAITSILAPSDPASDANAKPSTIATLPPAHFPTSLATLLSLPPSSDADAIPWSDAVGACFKAWGAACRDMDVLEEASGPLPNAFRPLWSLIEESHTPDVRLAAEKAIVDGLLGGTLGKNGRKKEEDIEGAEQLLVKECLKVWGKGPKNVKKTALGLIITTLQSALDSVSVASSGALGNILSIVASVVDFLGTNSEVGGPTPAVTLAPPLLAKVGELRGAKGFVWREKADEVLAAGIRAMGPAAFLEVLPLHLIPDKEAPSRDGRAYLLPLLASNLVPRTANVGHFVSYFVPLSEKLFELQSGAEKEAEHKIWEVCINQVWACFRGYCTGLAGLREGLSTPFLQLLTNLLYSQPTLRVSILHGVRALIASNRAIPADEIHYSYTERTRAEENLKFLAGLAGNMLSVLFNVFSNVESTDRGLVGEVIGMWLGVADAKELSVTFKKVSALLTQHLKSTPTPTAHTTLDLLILLVPHLSPSDGAQLFTITFADNVVASSDGTVQKKAYRILARLVERGIVDGLQEGEGRNGKAEQTLVRSGELTSGVNIAAKRDRVQFLASLVPLIPDASLHVLPPLLPEAVLATKEVSEKTRNGAFDLLVAMGRRMEQGGTVDRGKVDGMEVEEDQAPAHVKANVEEYVTMVAAGLAGATPHMISATITALSRLTFEFKSAISPNMLSEMITTLVVFISSANREIVKSALGFAKVATISLPTAIVSPHLSALIPALLGWSHDHKNHFKTKVLHILERMGRRFGWAAVEAAAGTHERAGVVVHLRKKKERAKKKKEKAGEESDGEDAAGIPTKVTTGDAFEDVLYGSDSDESDAGSTVASSKPSKNQKGKSKTDMRIRLDNDDPMDLLHGSAARLTTDSVQQSKRRQPGREAAKFKMDPANGKMIVEESEDEDEGEGGEDVAGGAYREMITSTDGQTRDARGRVKFGKDTKKRRAAEQEGEGEDVEMADGTAVTDGSRKKKKKQAVVKVGGEFKAKNAGGDVKKPGQQDPYAYLPLGSLNKKKGRPGPRVSITGRR
ncbi:ribosomal RNA-processing protein 12 [Ceratobasidium sp. AG-Ba]|nr:ribosomal RNA-processing protein 12 [Ceratobasidium sp. AG-Ba]